MNNIDYKKKYLKYKKKYLNLKGGASLVSNKIYNFYNDQIHIIPDIDEVENISGLDKENYSAREGVEKCNISKTLLTKVNDCTYDNKLNYTLFPLTKVLEVSPNIFDKLISKIGLIIENKEKEWKDKQINFFIVSHHHKLKKIFKEVSNDKKLSRIANCSCVKLINKNNKLDLKFIFGGFPDKKEGTSYKDKYYKTDSVINTNITLNSETNKYLYLKDENINIYFIRHGNSLHNKPVTEDTSLFGTKIKIGVKLDKAYSRKYLDSTLTPLGILQARLLGVILKSNAPNIFDGLNVLCASDLNRAQHTVLQLFHELFKQESNFFKLKEKFHNDSIDKFNDFMKNRKNKERIFEKEIEKIFNMKYLPKANLTLTEMLKLISNKRRAQSVIEQTKNKKPHKKERAVSSYT
jgi:broad specificity phosphatase PhoE